MADFDEKTLDPTPHRRQEARERGQFARSHDLNAAGLLLGGVAALLVTGRQLLDFLARLMIDHLSGNAWLEGLQAGQAYSTATLIEHWNALVPALAAALVPLVALALGASLAVQLAQSGLMFRPEQAAPDFARVSPLAGLARLWSAGSLARLAFGLLKIGAIGAMTFWCLYHRRGELASISALSVDDLARYVWETCLWTCAKIAMGLGALALVDYGIARWRFERDLRMTPQELREEMRVLQGDPQLLARRRDASRQASRARVGATMPLGGPGEPRGVNCRPRSSRPGRQPVTTRRRQPGSIRTCAGTCPSGGRFRPAARRESGSCPCGIPCAA